MPYTCPKLDELDGHQLVGAHPFDALAQASAKAPPTTPKRFAPACR